MAERSRSTRRRWVIIFGLLAVTGSGAFVQFSSNDDDRRDLGGFRIVYDVSVHVSTGEESSRREVAVRRPFSGSDLTFANDEDLPQSGAIADGAHVYTIQQGTAFDHGEFPPGAPPGDLRFASVLDDLVRLDLLDERGAERVGGRPCGVYRSGAPLGDPLRPPSEAEFVEWCIDDDGLLLHERWFLDGDLVRETTAITVETTEPDAGAFEVSMPIAPAPTGETRREDLKIDQRPEVGGLPYYVVTGDVDGLTLESRWRSVTVSSATSGSQVQDIVFVDVYRRDTDVVWVMHREQPMAGEQPDGYEQVNVSSLGEGQVHLDHRGAELRFEVDPWVVAVRGTLAVADLTDFAAALTPIGP